MSPQESIHPIRELAAALGVEPPDPYSQDCEYEIADSGRVSEWLQTYSAGNWSDPQRILLMKAIIASQNDALANGTASAVDWHAIADILARDSRLHHETVIYWCDWGTELEDSFPITTPMRAFATPQPG